MIKINIRDNKFVFTVIALSIPILQIAALLNNNVLHFLGCFIFFIGVVFSDEIGSLLLMAAITPNISILCLSNESIGLIGLAYLLLLVKELFLRKNNLVLKKKMIIPILILIFIGASRVIKGNYYDIVIIIQFSIVLIYWDNMYRTLNMRNKLQIYHYFEVGALFMSIGMFAQFVLFRESGTRLHALLDDPNYTSVIFSVLLISNLLIYCFKLKVRYSIFFIIFSIIMGLLTGSRGFLLSIGICLFIFFIYSINGKRERKIIYFCFAGLFIFVGLYLVGNKYAVTIYDNIIDRTLKLLFGHTSGNFMDISSGRFFLWNYYIENTLNTPVNVIFGTGFNNYFLVENGGYGLAAHNAYLSSVIGVGVLGTVCIIYLYYLILKKYINLKIKKSFLFGTIMFCVMISYIFLDGILDLRIIMYLIIYLIINDVWKNRIKNIGGKKNVRI